MNSLACRGCSGPDQVPVQKRCSMAWMTTSEHDRGPQNIHRSLALLLLACERCVCWSHRCSAHLHSDRTQDLMPLAGAFCTLCDAPGCQAAAARLATAALGAKTHKPSGLNPRLHLRQIGSAVGDRDLLQLYRRRSQVAARPACGRQNTSQAEPQTRPPLLSGQTPTSIASFSACWLQADWLRGKRKQAKCDPVQLWSVGPYVSCQKFAC